MGSIILTRPKKGRRRLRITIKSSQMEILWRCKDLLGGYISSAGVRSDGSQTHIYVLGSELAYDFLDRNYSSLTHPVKRARADHISKYYRNVMSKEEIETFERDFFTISSD